MSDPHSEVRDNGDGTYTVIRVSYIHKAAPKEGSNNEVLCRHCNEWIKVVPSGNGSTWVHESTGMVVGQGGNPNPTGYIEPTHAQRADNERPY